LTRSSPQNDERRDPLRLADELEIGLRSVVDDAPGSVSYYTVLLTPRQATELEERLRALIGEYERTSSTSRSARRFGVLGVLAPLPGEGEA
jgi:hypothetical protein